MIRRVFIYKNGEYGLGLRPVGVPHADALRGMGVAHDILEHFPGDNGGIECELMALGACVLIRIEEGYWQNSSSKPAEILSGDIPGLLSHHFYEEFNIRSSGCTKKLTNDWAEAIIQETIQIGLKHSKEEFAGDFIENNSLTANNFVGWMRRGYRKASRRWQYIEGYHLCSTFQEIERQIDKVLDKEQLFENQKVIVVCSPKHEIVRIFSDVGGYLI